MNVPSKVIHVANNTRESHAQIYLEFVYLINNYECDTKKSGAFLRRWESGNLKSIVMDYFHVRCSNSAIDILH